MGESGGSDVDPLAPGARASRTASWGVAPAAADDFAARLVRRFATVTGATPDCDWRSAADARRTPPRIPASRMDPSAIDALARIAPVHTDDASRRAYSLGKSLPDMIAARGDALAAACDAVVRPRTEDELEHAFDHCVDAGHAIVPVGGGTNVVGGIEPIGASAGQPVVALDVTALAACLDIDHVSNVATFQAGVRGPELERALAPFGFTLGHVPQSFEYSTLGGWVATRSAGQQSLRYGKIESMTAALRIVSPAGTLDVDHVPAHGAGSDLRELLLGSEGTFGVVTRATMRLHRRPDAARFAAYLFRDFETASEAARVLVQETTIRPATVRVSDAAETALSVGASVPFWLGGAVGRGAARLFGAAGGAMTIVVCTGTASEARDIERRVDRHMRRSGGRGLGPTPARAWHHGRFVQPYARDGMLDRGMLIDTLETSASWARLPRLIAEVRSAITHAIGSDRCRVGAHLSHLYRDGASAYFTFLAAPGPGQELQRWRAAKRAAHETIARCGGATSHQHGVGTMHADLYAARMPRLGIDALLSVRIRLDPSGACNPGKLFDAPADGQIAINAVRAIDPSAGDPEAASRRDRS